MSVTVNSLYNETKSIYRLKWLAGFDSADNPVSWMYYTEDLSTLDFIRGGELVVTTGMSIGKETDESEKDRNNAEDYLSILIQKLHEIKASGLIVNIGKYIPDIPENIIALCNRLSFPLFTLPWEIHTIDVMQDYGNRIVNERQIVHKLENTLSNAIFNPSDFDAKQLENTPFENAGNYSIMLIELPEEFYRLEKKSLYNYMNFSLNSKIGIQPDDYCFFLHQKYLIYIFHRDITSAVKKTEAAFRKDKYFRQMKISISSKCISINELPKEFEHALLAMKLCDEEKLFCDYSQLGFFQILGEIKDKALLENFYDQVLGKLNAFSKDKRKDYLTTLKIYLSSSGRIQKTAEENYTHRNTVNYRIKKISEILNVDINDGNTRFMLQTALYIREILDKISP